MGNEIFVVLPPQLGVNDQTVVVVKWHVPEGEYVAVGTPICSLETTKAVFDVESETKGYLAHLVDAKAEIKINQPIALIGTDRELLLQEKKKYVRQAESKIGNPGSLPGDIKATLKAQELAQKLNIDLSRISVNGIIREQDVLNYHGKGGPGQTTAAIDISWKPSRIPVIIYGAGRGAVAVTECLHLQDDYQVVCFLDDNPNHSPAQCGLPVYHSSRLEEIIKKGARSMAVAVAAGNVRLRIRKQCMSLGMDLINVIHPEVLISPSVRIGKGNYINSGTIIETNSQVGDCCIIGNGVIIPHDNTIGDGCHIAPGVSMGSSIKVSELAIVGIGASVSTGVTIGRGAIISVGSSVIKDVPEFVVIEGVPGKIVGERKAIRE